VSAAVVVQAYRFALDPTASQVRDLHRHAGAARFAFNWALAAVKANMGQRAAERSYGVSAAAQGVRDGVMLGGHGGVLKSPAGRVPGGAWCSCCRGGAQSVATVSLIAVLAEDSSTIVLLVL
jgi:hypothetical protein